MKTTYQHTSLSLTEQDRKLKEEIEQMSGDQKSHIGIYRMGLNYLYEYYMQKDKK